MGGWCGGGQARAFLEATVVFIDIKGFTAGCAEMTVEQVRGPDAMLGGSESEMYKGSGRKRAAKPGSACGVRRGTAGSDRQSQMLVQRRGSDQQQMLVQTVQIRIGSVG